MKRMLAIATVTAICVLGLMDIATLARRQAGQQGGTSITGGGQSIGGVGITRGTVQAPGEPYVNCGSAAQQYQKLSTALPKYQQHIQDEINRESRMLQQGKEGVTEAQREQDEALFKGALGEAKDLGGEAIKSSQGLEKALKQAHLSFFQRGTLKYDLEGVRSLGKRVEAAQNLAKETKSVHSLWGAIKDVNEYGVKSGAYDKLGEEVCTYGFGPECKLAFMAANTTIDVGVAEAQSQIDLGEEQRAANTINSLRSQLNNFQEKIADLGSNLHQYCSRPNSQQASNNPPDSTTMVRPPAGSSAAKGSVPASAVKAGGGSHALPIILGAVVAGGGVAAYEVGKSLKNSQQKSCPVNGATDVTLACSPDAIALLGQTQCTTTQQNATAYCQCEGFSSYKPSQAGSIGFVSPSQVCQ